MIAFSSNYAGSSLEQQQFDRLIELPPSAKLVFRVLQEEHPLTAAEISERTLLPNRTTRYALAQLKEANIVETRPDVYDERRQLYLPQSIADESNPSE